LLSQYLPALGRVGALTAVFSFAVKTKREA